MKKTKHTGLQAGVYHENEKKNELFSFITNLLVFLALAVIFHTAANFSAMLPLLGAGALPLYPLRNAFRERGRG